MALLHCFVSLCYDDYDQENLHGFPFPMLQKWIPAAVAQIETINLPQQIHYARATERKMSNFYMVVSRKCTKSQ